MKTERSGKGGYFNFRKRKHAEKKWKIDKKKKIKISERIFFFMCVCVYVIYFPELICAYNLWGTEINRKVLI